MPTFEHIKSYLSDNDEVLHTQEFILLPDIVSDNETIKSILKGWYEKEPCLLCATNQRIIVIRKETSKEFWYSHITSAVFRDGWFKKSILFNLGERAIVVDLVPKDRAIQFVAHVNHTSERKIMGELSEDQVIQQIKNIHHSIETLERLVEHLANRPTTMEKRVEALIELTDSRDDMGMTKKEFQLQFNAFIEEQRIEALERLTRLKEKGAITTEEFESEKQAILK